jgi:dihydrodipicolinate synthase/N-acetylneuraminate lyase
MGLAWQASDLRGVIALVPTPTKEGAEHWRTEDVVDLDETERMIRAILQDGATGVATNGTLGEMATLLREEWERFVAVVWETVRAIDPDRPLFIGATTLGTRETISRLRYLRKLGVRGTLLGRPFWSQLAPEAIIAFYRDIAEGFPEIAVLLYDNPEAFKGPIPTPVYAALADSSTVIGVKYVSLTPKYRADMDAVRGKIRLLPLESDWFWAWTLYPDEALGCWSSSMLCGPEPVRYLAEALERGDIEAARWITHRIEWTYEPFLARQNFQQFSRYNIPLEKIRFNAAGYVKAGPPLPPYHVVPENYRRGALEHAARWRQLVSEVQARRAMLA